MTYEPRLARLAAMIADPARSRMLAYLLAGHYASAGELAAAASVSASTASGHLAKLRGTGLLASEKRGRHRYFKLADADVAHALEALAVIAERGSHERQWNAPGRHQLRYARRCYGHLAGELGVALCDSLVANRRIEASQDGYLSRRKAGSGSDPSAWSRLDHRLGTVWRIHAWIGPSAVTTSLAGSQPHCWITSSHSGGWSPTQRTAPSSVQTAEIARSGLPAAARRHCCLNCSAERGRHLRHGCRRVRPDAAAVTDLLPESFRLAT